MTFNDVPRRAMAEASITRSTSGHPTERMQDHYSTVSLAEQRESIAKGIDLFGTKPEAAPSGAPVVESGAPKKSLLTQCV